MSKKIAVGGIAMVAAAVVAGHYYIGREALHEAWDTDPAYQIYQQNREYYREYEYMIRAGEDGLELSMEEHVLGPGGPAGPVPGLTGGAGAQGSGTGDGPAGQGPGLAGGQAGQGPGLAGGLAGQGPGLAGGQAGQGPGLAGGSAGQAPGSAGGLAEVPGPALSAAASGQRPVHLAAQLADYDYLMGHFYNVHSSTTAGRELMNAEKFLNRDFVLADLPGPQILIYHTHSQETFADYSAARPDANIVTVGTELASQLRAMGYEVIHDTSVYDLKGQELDRSKAYTYALEGITAILQEYPSIQVILDIHRDGVKEGLHLVWDYEGEPAAQIMFFHGTSRTPEGPIEYLANPYVEDNMAFTFQMQMDAAAAYPGMARKIYLKGLRYNLHLRPRSALIEVGAQTNTVDEALRSMKPLAELLDNVLQGK